MDITGPKGHLRSRPPAVEGEAANRAVAITEALGNTICVVDPGIRSAAATCGGGDSDAVESVEGVEKGKSDGTDGEDGGDGGGDDSGNPTSTVSSHWRRGVVTREGIAGLALLGPVHCGVGTFDQGLYSGAVSRKDRDANTGADRQFTDADITRHFNCFDDFFCNGGCVLIVTYFHEQVQKFVTAMTADRIVDACSFFKSLGNRQQNSIACIVAVGVIDRFEFIKVHEHHGQSPAMPFGLLHSMLQPIIKEHAIW